MSENGNPKTRKQLMSALSKARRVSESNGSRLSVSAVAREAGVSHSLIFNDYSDIAAKIRRFAGNDEEAKAKKAELKLMALERRFGELSTEVERLRGKNLALVNRNANLEQSIDTMRQQMRAVDINDAAIFKVSPGFAEKIIRPAESGDEAMEKAGESKQKALERHSDELRDEIASLRLANRAIVSRNATLELALDAMQRHINSIDAGATPIRPFTLSNEGKPTVLPFRRR